MTMVQCWICKGAVCVHAELVPFCSYQKAKRFVCSQCSNQVAVKCEHCTNRFVTFDVKGKTAFVPKTRDEMLHLRETRRLVLIAANERKRLADIETSDILKVPVSWDNIKNGLITGDAETIKK